MNPLSDGMVLPIVEPLPPNISQGEFIDSFGYSTQREGIIVLFSSLGRMGGIIVGEGERAWLADGARMQVKAYRTQGCTVADFSPFRNSLDYWHIDLTGASWSHGSRAAYPRI